MKIFKCNTPMSGEDWERWQNYLESKEPNSILLPQSIDFVLSEADDPVINFTPDDDDSEETEVNS